MTVAGRKPLRDFFQDVHVPYEGIATDDAVEVVKTQPIAVLDLLVAEWGVVVLRALIDAVSYTEAKES